MGTKLTAAYFADRAAAVADAQERETFLWRKRQGAPKDLERYATGDAVPRQFYDCLEVFHLTIDHVHKRIDALPEFGGMTLEQREYDVLWRWLTWQDGDEAVMHFGPGGRDKAQEIAKALRERRPVLYRGRTLSRPL